MHDLSRIVIWCIVQSTMFGLIAGVIYLAARRFGPRVGASVATAAVLGFGFLSLAALSPWPQWELRRFASDELALPLATERAVDQQIDMATEVTTPHAESRMDSFSPSVIEVFLDAFADTLMVSSAFTARQQPWTNHVALLFLAGFGSFVAWRVLGLWALRRQVNQSFRVTDKTMQQDVDMLRAELALTRHLEIRQSELLTTAATVGFRRPVILLPVTWCDWSCQERRVVLAHELAHIARHDFLTWMFAQIGVLTHFYHPLVHWLASRMRLEQELAADDLAARMSGGRKVYLTTLAQLALRSASPTIVWPAQAFLPTRSMFLRRLEMLRQSQLTHEHRWASATRAMSLATLMALAVFICGVRPPGTATALAQTVASASSESDDAESSDFDWRSVCEGAMVVAVARPAAILATEKMKPMAAKLNQLFIHGETELPIKVEQVQELWVVVRGKSQPQTVVRTKAPLRADRIVFQLLRKPKQEMHRGQTYYIDGDARQAILVLNGRTFIFGSEDGIRESIEKLATNSQPSAWMADFQESRDSQAAVFLNASELAKAKGKIPPELPLQMFAHLLDDVNYVVMRANLLGTTQVDGTVSTFSPQAAQRTAATLEAAFVLGQNLMRANAGTLANSKDVPEEAREPMKKVLAIAEQLLSNAKANADGQRVKLAATAEEGGDMAIVMATLLPAIEAAREAARRTQSMNNLRQVGIAVMNYESAHGHFPPPVILGPDGKTPHSWRVAILPFLEKEDLYERYRFDEPWDSTFNQKLLAEMPTVFRSPSDRQGSQSTSYFALTGGQTVFGTSRPRTRDQGTQIREVRDGTANTIMLVEAKNEVPWTKPVDIEIADDQPLPDFGGWHAGDIFLTSFADVSIRVLSKSIEQNRLRDMITKAGGESIQLD